MVDILLSKVLPVSVFQVFSCYRISRRQLLLARMSPSHEALLALLDSADGDGAHAPSPRESAGTGDTGTTSSYAMVDAGGGWGA